VYTLAETRIHSSVKLILFCYMQLGALAVVIRQTNIIWMFFVACIGVIDTTLTHERDKIEVNENENEIDAAIRKTDRLTSKNNVTWGLNLRKRKFSSTLDTYKHSIPSTSIFSANHTSGLNSHF
jgi:alpha-1,2-glucosyltransferase